MNPMNPMARGLVVTAMLSGALIVVAVLLWVSEVIGLPLFLGAVVLISVAQMGVTMRILAKQKQAMQGRAAARDDRSPGDGFDPMKKFR
ncbi:hypothetical protein [Occultella gossypii]|uniref:Uncharacterized protein n=1 Tax=Occultella gossypii TaxID=2800820 RepID=A0ABS7SJF0_9MICO|nr:hypothetical protein [Occultella gossypii]MBZ2199418.1 hypothetical protein [Occultella gossypii]